MNLTLKPDLRGKVAHEAVLAALMQSLEGRSLRNVLIIPPTIPAFTLIRVLLPTSTTTLS